MFVYSAPGCWMNAWAGGDSAMWLSTRIGKMLGECFLRIYVKNFFNENSFTKISYTENTHNETLTLTHIYEENHL